MPSSYNPLEIEAKWQKIWEEKNIYQTPEPKRMADKKYVLDMFPYPSGAGLHVGHPEGYTATDIYSRYLRMNGFKVLHPMGWDAFGLPAENYAIHTGVHPAQSTRKNISIFKRQIKRLGLSYDWNREIDTSSPDYYKWTQWIFLRLYKKGLAYRKKAPVNWCPGCATVLANEQVVDGKCHRSGDIVVQKELEQWFFKITDYAQELLDGLEGLDWSESIKAAQRNWIGKSEGAEIEFRIKNSELRIKVFTTRPDTLFGTTYLVLAPEHQLISNLTRLDSRLDMAKRAEIVPRRKSQISNWKEVEGYINNAKKKTDLQRTDLAKEKIGIELKGMRAINPINKQEIPIWIADYVLASYGTGAIMAVPAHDERDFEFAKKYRLPMKLVISQIPPVSPSDCRDGSHTSKLKINQAFVENGWLVNSDKYSAMDSLSGGRRIIYDLKKKGLAEFKTQFKLRDWLVSRQRYWGAPIPIVYCRKCSENYENEITEIEGVKYAIIPVPEKDLPVKLPNDVDFKPTGESPLQRSKSFHDVKCPNCHSPARRESDTMDTFVDSSWYYLAYSAKNISDFEFRASNLENSNFESWLPVDMYVGGAEHAVLHLLYSRFITRALKDLGYLNFDEPFLSLRNQGLILAPDGRKMSKSLCNVINPDDVVNKYGTDTFRIYEMFMGPLQDAKPWSTRGIIGVYRFLNGLWKFGSNPKYIETSENDSAIEKLKSQVSKDIEKMSFNTAIADLMKFVKDIRLKISDGNWKDFLIILFPFAPHLAEELWQRAKFEGSVLSQKWVKADESLVRDKIVKLPVQINKKIRAVIEVESKSGSKEIEQIALNHPKIKLLIQGKKYKTIVVPLKIVSIVVYN